MPPPSLSPETAKAAKFYSARSNTIPPLPWQTFALPFSDPALKTKPASERCLVQARVTSVVQAIPVLTQMRETIRQRDRAPDLGKDHGRGIER